jgi:hypothetical protein
LARRCGKRIARSQTYGSKSTIQKFFTAERFFFANEIGVLEIEPLARNGYTQTGGVLTVTLGEHEVGRIAKAR